MDFSSLSYLKNAGTNQCCISLECLLRALQKHKGLADPWILEDLDL